MNENTGNVDRVIRIVAAVGAGIAAFLVGPTTVIGIVLLVVAAILVVTAAVGFCPLYRLFGASTRPVQASTTTPTKVPSGR